MSIAENRHHRARVLANRCNYNMASKQPYKMIKTPCLCSCWMCCNPRKLHGNGHGAFKISDQRKLTNPDF